MNCEPKTIPYLRLLYSGLCDHDFSRRSVMVLQAYFDDSKKTLGKPYLFLAGFLDSAENWIAFSNNWRSALNEGKSISYFKASEAKAGRGEFKGWHKLDREVKINQLTSVALQSAPLSFHIAIDLKAHSEHFDKDGVPWGFRTPYWLSFEMMVTWLLKFQVDRGDDNPIDFIFDEQTQIQSTASTLFEALKAAQPASARKLIRSAPVFRNDKDFLPIQAADLLAWNIQRGSINGAPSPKDAPASKLLNSGRHRYMSFSKEELALLSERLMTSDRLSEVSTKKQWRSVMDKVDQESTT